MSNPLIARFAGEPALVEPAQAARFEACLASLAGHEHAEALMSAASSEDFWNPEDRWIARFRPYVVVNGILQIPIKGVLLNNFPYQLYDWATGYEYIWEAFKRGAADFAIGAIKGIALVCDTPGGMVAGCFDARDKMIALKEETGVPVAGFAHEAAYSAGYAMITVADKGRIHVSRTGGVGSIGVVTGHLNVSGAMEKAGLVFTYIYAGDGKVEGNPYEALSDEARNRIQARIDELYGIFVSAVARSRGLEESFIRETLGAHCYTATQSTSNGLADLVGSLDDSLSAFAGSLDAPSDTSGEDDMADQATSAVDQAALDAAREEGRTAGAAEASTAATTRIAAILGSDEAKGRDAQAQHFAFKTNMSAEDAIAALAVGAKETAATPPAPTPFANAMDQSNNPNAGANVDEDEDDKATAKVDEVFALRGIKPKA